MEIKENNFEFVAGDEEPFQATIEVINVTPRREEIIETFNLGQNTIGLKNVVDGIAALQIKGKSLEEAEKDLEKKKDRLDKVLEKIKEKEEEIQAWENKESKTYS